MRPDQVAVHAATAGWRGSDLVTAVAVAWAQSGGDPARPGGLWGPPGTAGDPAAQATAAHARWKSGGWAQWSVYRSNKYLLFMPLGAAAAAAPNVVAVIAKDAAGDVIEQLPGVDAVSDAVALGVKASAWMSERHNWVRVAQVIIGAGLIWAGLVSLAGSRLSTQATKVMKIVDKVK